MKIKGKFVWMGEEQELFGRESRRNNKKGLSRAIRRENKEEINSFLSDQNNEILDLTTFVPAPKENEVYAQFTKLCMFFYGEAIGKTYSTVMISLYEQGIRDVRLGDMAIYLIDELGF
jgi:hypothetical protein